MNQLWERHPPSKADPYRNMKVMHGEEGPGMPQFPQGPDNKSFFP